MLNIVQLTPSQSEYMDCVCILLSVYIEANVFILYKRLYVPGI